MNKIKVKILGLLFICMFPFLMFFFSFFEKGMYYPSIFSIRRVMIMFKTIGFGLIVSLFVIILSWSLAYLLMITVKSGNRVLFILLGFMMIPPFFHAYLAMTVMYKIFGMRALSGIVISILVQSMYLIPLGTMLWYIFFGQIKGEYYDEVRLHVHQDKYKITTLLTMSKGVVGIIFGLVFILGITDFTIPSIFAFNTFPIEIMAIFSSQPYLGVPLMISIPMIVLTIIVFIIMSRSYQVKATSHELNIKVINLWEDRFSNRLVLYILVAIIVMVYSFMFTNIGSLKESLPVILQYKDEYLFTLVTSCLASVFVVIVSYLLCYYLSLIKEMETFVFMIMIIVYSVPNTIVGLLVNGFYVKLIDLFPVMEWIYFSYIPVIHLYLIKFLPIGFAIIYIGFSSFATERILQARLNSSKTFNILVASTLYSMKDFMIVSFFITLILSIGELGGSIMVVPPGASTMTITIYNYLHYGSTDIVSVLSFLLSLIILGLLLIMIRLLKIVKI